LSLVILFLEIGFVAWFIHTLRSPNFRQAKPSFKQVTVLFMITVVILAFAGVQPMSTYKDNLIESWRITQTQTKLEPVKPPQTTQTKPPDIITPKVESPTPAVTVDSERMAFDLINAERVKAGLSPTVWDDRLYQLSKSHTQEMANRKQLFHSPMGGDIGEDAWGGYGYSAYSGAELAQVIVQSWISSPLHKAWILYAPIEHSVVSIVSNSDGQYASWTFWTSEVGAGPPLIQKAYNLWQSETGGEISWLDWLYNIKGYPNNPDFLKQLGVN
jgi:uncharacterized protein YkwD